MPNDSLERFSYISELDNIERDCWLYLPEGYHQEPEKDWPLMLFLHGNGERGNGKEELEYVLRHGPLYHAWVKQNPLPFIIVAPQLPMFDLQESGPEYLKTRKLTRLFQRTVGVVPADEPEYTRGGPITGKLEANMDEMPLTLPKGWDNVQNDLIGLLDTIESHSRVSKTVLTGLSYGGFGTWYMASKYPERFSAIAPVVGWGHPDLMAPIAKHQIPLWCFAAGRDYSVRPQYFYAGLNTLEELGHPYVRFTIHEDMAHDAWKRVYSSVDFYDWLRGLD